MAYCTNEPVSALRSKLRVGQAEASRLSGDIVHALHAIFHQAIRTLDAGDAQQFLTAAFPLMTARASQSISRILFAPARSTKDNPASTNLLRILSNCSSRKHWMTDRLLPAGVGVKAKRPSKRSKRVLPAQAACVIAKPSIGTERAISTPRSDICLPSLAGRVAVVSASRVPRALDSGAWEIAIPFTLCLGMQRNIDCAAMLRRAGICGPEHDAPYLYRWSAFRTVRADNDFAPILSLVRSSSKSDGSRTWLCARDVLSGRHRR